MRYLKVYRLTKKAYDASSLEISHWMWENHVQLVGKKTEELAKIYNADIDLAAAAAWLHDFGDAFVMLRDKENDEASVTEAVRVLKAAGYSDNEIRTIMNTIISSHSCKNGHMPTTIEGKVLATADAWAHLSTDFYIQMAWKNLPRGKTYQEYKEWSREKIERDFNTKIFFDEIKDQVKDRYLALKETYNR